MRMCDHPVYNKYFKMLKLGIPEQAIKIKMASEGVDPAFLRLYLLSDFFIRSFRTPDTLVEFVETEEANNSRISESDSN